MKKNAVVLALTASAFLCGCATAPLGQISGADSRGFVFFDTETTGLGVETNRIIEITMYNEDGWFSTLVNPGEPISRKITDITGITTEMVKDAPTFGEIAPEVFRRLSGRTAVAHNAQFDMRFTLAELARAGISVTNEFGAICTLKTERALRQARKEDSPRKGNSLTECLARRGIVPENAHRAEDDVRSLIELYKCQKREGAAFNVDYYSQPTP